MQIFFTDVAPAPWLPFPTIVVRLLAALLCGALIGFERERKRRAAGLRTHMLVCLAAATVSILTIEMLHLPSFQSDTVRVDPIRLVEAITSGVAFLAAGLIVFTKGQVRNLTTGAGMWLAGIVGLGCGLGLLHVAFIASVPAIVVLWALAKFEDRLAGNSGNDTRDAPSGEGG